jgi:nucleotide-binding universal stress UspA family protein
VTIRHELTPPLNAATILVGYDGSSSAQRALEWAVALARPFEAKVIAAYVWKATASEVRPRLHKKLASDATESIATWARSVSPDVLPTSIEGDPRMEVVKLAEQHDATLVVVGRRGTGGVRALRIGSVASHLATSSPVPVAVVPLPPDDDQAEA